MSCPCSTFFSCVQSGGAAALATAAVNALHATGAQVLRSRFWLGNVESRTWCYRFGFVDEPDLIVTRIYYHHVLQWLEWGELTGKISPTEREELLAQLDLLRKADREMFERLASARQQ
jgi:hypothetical protein